MDQLYFFFQSTVNVTQGFTLYATTGAERAQRLWSLQGVKLKFSLWHKGLHWSNDTGYSPSMKPLVWIKVSAMWTTVCTPVETFCCSQKYLYPKGENKRIGASCGEAQSYWRGQFWKTPECQQHVDEEQCKTAVLAEGGSCTTAIRWPLNSPVVMVPSGFRASSSVSSTTG